MLRENSVDVFFNARFVSAQDLLEQSLAVRQPFEWIRFASLIILAGDNRVKVSDQVGKCRI